jgi:hypothetical protein
MGRLKCAMYIVFVEASPHDADLAMRRFLSMQLDNALRGALKNDISKAKAQFMMIKALTIKRPETYLQKTPGFNPVRTAQT